jgi:hypothetical protein
MFLKPLVIGITAICICSCHSPSMGMFKKNPFSKLASISMPKFHKPKLGVPKFKEIKKGDIARFSFKDLLPSKVAVVDVRGNDLKEFKSGKDRALAYQSTKRKFSNFYGLRSTEYADFIEPALPAGTGDIGEIENPELGLLPPKPQ